MKKSKKTGANKSQRQSQCLLPGSSNISENKSLVLNDGDSHQQENIDGEEKNENHHKKNAEKRKRKQKPELLISLSDTSMETDVLIKQTKANLSQFVAAASLIPTHNSLQEEGAHDLTQIQDFLNDPATIKVQSKHQKTRVVPKELSSASANSIHGSQPINYRRQLSNTTVSKSAEQYARGFDFPPIKICPMNKNVRLNGEAVMRFINDFKTEHCQTFKISFWRISNGRILLYSQNRETFSCLLDERIFPRLLDNQKFEIEWPRKIPAQLSLLMLGVPSGTNIDELRQDVQKNLSIDCYSR
ncbi:unnamed protein product [Didymodactylos carnosus]|uniref:Uncharacterized protein n=1 Tax=Didymodactylos carnosus TaxID=1234261 RepID=A0A814MGK5_9BILA|nr:unnamed protein product [Didymodactylos carnosus]CAF3845519.1 unnamed protein product [Didymodactylos carnosus]